MKFEWEIICEDHNGRFTSILERIRVRGGWIVRDWHTEFKDNIITDINCKWKGSSIIFIPDPEHKWEIDQ